MRLFISFLGLILNFASYAVDDDKALFYSKLDTLTSLKADKVSIEQISSSFLNTPYVAHTLEVGDREQLVVNLRGLDCTTYVENVLAFKQILDKKQQNIEDFRDSLEFIRYRDGNLKGYSSRLHYFSDWLVNNEKKGLIKRLTKSLGGEPLNKKIDFMSTHPNAYQRINQANLNEIKQIEAQLAEQQLFYIPIKSIADVSNKLQTGDIVAIATKIKGLDVTHVGFAYRKADGKLHLQHASTTGAVVISKQPLLQYLQKNSNNSGIMVARIL